MPRANRYFLPGYVWHITHLNSSQFQSLQPFHRGAPFKTFQAEKDSRPLNRRVVLFGASLWTALLFVMTVSPAIC
jgi:hypothetical protein